MVQTEAQSPVTEGSRELIDARALGLAAFAATTFDGADLCEALAAGVKPAAVGLERRVDAVGAVFVTGAAFHKRTGEAGSMVDARAESARQEVRLDSSIDFLGGAERGRIAKSRVREAHRLRRRPLWGRP